MAYVPNTWANGDIITKAKLDRLEAGAAAAALPQVSVLDHGAVGDGTTNDTTAIAAAFAACPDNGAVLFPAGRTYRVTSVQLLAKRVTVLAHGATIQAATAGTYAFVQANRQRLTWLGGRFVGPGSGYFLNLPASEAQSYDFAFTGVGFEVGPTQTGMYLKGGREGTITDCWFDECTGIRLAETVNTQIVGCQFRNCAKGVWGDGSTGTAFNAGVMINNCTMLGCGYGVHIVGHDWVGINNCMIDYCDQPVLLVNQDIATIQSCYLSNREYAGGTQVAPTIQVVTDTGQGGEDSKHIRIANCSIICNVGALPQQSIGVRFTGGVTWASITNCSLHFWRKYAIQVIDTSTYLKIVGNDMVRVGAETGAAAVRGSGGNDGTWLIADNYLSAPISNTVSPILRDNLT